MKTNIFKRAVFFILAFLFFFVVAPASVSLSQSDSGNVTVNALVPSDVSEDHSHVSVNQNEILADFVQRIVVIIRVHDADDNPLEGIRVTLTSNRGDIDHIRGVSAGELEEHELSTLFIRRAYAAEDENTAITNSEGMAYFEVKSSVPGDAILTPIADTLVQLDSVSVSFLSLPFPKNVTISVEVPKFISETGKVVLFKPEDTTEGKTEEEIEKEKLVNMGVELNIPFWLFAITAFLVILSPIMFIIIIILLRKVRKTEKKEMQLLEKEEQEIEEIERKL